MKTALIGNTGFVGANLRQQFSFDDEYNSKNILDIKGKEYDLVICSAIPSSMWMANNFAQKDLENIKNLLAILKNVSIKKFVLISSICVFKPPVQNINEDSNDFEDEQAYGKNRRYAEKEITNIFDDCLIIRLPALFGDHLKKNFIYDLLNQEPAFIANEKYQEILNCLDSQGQKTINNYYVFDGDKKIWSFDKEKAILDKSRNEVLQLLKKANFTALNFTNSKSNFQFYDLSDLHKDINIALKNNIEILHLCSAKIQALEIAKLFFNIDFDHDNGQKPFDYDLQTKHAKLWNKDSNYQYCKDDMVQKFEKFFSKNSS